MKKIGVLGAGSWGTALTWLLTNNGHEVTLWSIMKLKWRCFAQKENILPNFRV